MLTTIHIIMTIIEAILAAIGSLTIIQKVKERIAVEKAVVEADAVDAKAVVDAVEVKEKEVVTDITDIKD